MCTFNYFELLRKHSLGKKLSEAEINYLAYVEYTEYVSEKTRKYTNDIDWDLLLLDCKMIEDRLLGADKENGKE